MTIFRIAMTLLTWFALSSVVVAEDPIAPPARPAPPTIDIRQMFIDGGAIGYIIVVLSLVMLALIFEHLMTIRRQTLIPRGLEEDIKNLISQGQFKLAEERSTASKSFLGYLLAAGIKEVELGYSAVEKAMEDAAAQQASRLLRKIEYLSMISTVAPMLGLMGTVWGMILAFMEFERKANPQVSELAPGIYKALVTTLFGLIVAIPAIAAFGFFRNRIDELVAQTALTAEQVFADFKRTLALKRREERRAAHGHDVSNLPVVPIIRRETRMKIPTRTQDRGFAFNITPLIDVVFLLIIFFLVASHFIRNEYVERVALPLASQGKDEQEPASRLVVTVVPSGDLLFGTASVTLDEFERRLQILVGKFGAELTELRIRADRTVEYSKVEPLLLMAARNGVTRVRFAVLRQ